MRLIIRSFLFFLIIPIFAGCEQAPEADKVAAATPAPPPLPQCRLVMGWDPWQPYQYRNPQGEVTGLDVEIARAAAEAGGCELELTEASWMELMGRLQAGDVHLLGGATRTPGREVFAAFTAPYRAESFVLYTRADNAALRGATTLDVLLSDDTKLGTVTEYYYGPDISAVLDVLYAAGRLKEASVAELNYERLDMREIDAFLEDPFVASAILRNRPDAESVVPTGIRITADEVAFMLSKAGVSEDHIAKFSEGLEAIRADGRLAAIVESWRATR